MDSRHIIAAAAVTVVLLLAHTVVSAVAADAVYTHGVKVGDFLGPGLPAERAGIAIGDVILAIDGKRIGSSDDFLAAFKGKVPGDSMEVVTQRGTTNILLGSYFADADKPVLGVAIEDVALPLSAGAQPLAATANGLSILSLLAAACLFGLLSLQLPAIAGAFALAGLNALDVASTFLFLLAGKTEANPVGFALMHHIGFAGAALIKLGIMVLCAYILARLAQFKGFPGIAATRTLHALVIVYGVVVFRNMWLLI